MEIDVVRSIVEALCRTVTW